MRIFTTGQVAKICKVAPRTVSKWFDSNELKGYRIPGSKDRRIPAENLRAFMARHEVPMELLDDFIAELEAKKNPPEVKETETQATELIDAHQTEATEQELVPAGPA